MRASFKIWRSVNPTLPLVSIILDNYPDNFTYPPSPHVLHLLIFSLSAFSGYINFFSGLPIYDINKILYPHLLTKHSSWYMEPGSPWVHCCPSSSPQWKQCPTYRRWHQYSSSPYCHCVAIPSHPCKTQQKFSSNYTFYLSSSLAFISFLVTPSRSLRNLVPNSVFFTQFLQDHGETKAVMRITGLDSRFS